MHNCLGKLVGEKVVCSVVRQCACHTHRRHHIHHSSATNVISITQMPRLSPKYHIYHIHRSFITYIISTTQMPQVLARDTLGAWFYERKSPATTTCTASLRRVYACTCARASVYNGSLAPMAMWQQHCNHDEPLSLCQSENCPHPSCQPYESACYNL